MNKKLVLIGAAFVFFGSLLVLQGVFGQEDAFTIENPGFYTTDRYQGASFAHKKHADEFVKDCTKCHHNYKEGATPQKCTSCHTKDSKVTAKKAFHDICRNCHRKYKKEGKKAGPTLCTKCHAKK